jgi:antitoxin ParD1/3/4
MAQFVRENVARGDYASDSEVLRDALRVLRERDRAVESWLREQAVPAAQALRDDPARALTPIKCVQSSRNRERVADKLAGPVCARGTHSAAVSSIALQNQARRRSPNGYFDAIATSA